MKLSTKTKYGIRALLEVALNYEKGPVQTRLIAERQQISVKYLEQLMAILKSAGFVKSIRGAKGGYILARPPASIKVGDVVKALEGPLTTVDCLDDGSRCTLTADCIARQLWLQLQQAIDSVLQTTTLQSLIDKAKQSSESNISYQI